MAEKIPAIPTKNVKFEKGVLTFEILKNCAYCKEDHNFVGGKWEKARLRSEEGEPMSVKLDGYQLIISKLVNFAVEVNTGHIVGGEWIEVAKINVCD